jgi:hypothetical protein
VLLLPSARTQAVPRTDTPRAGTLRATFEPVITIWEREFTTTGEQRIGASLPTTVFVHKEQRITPLGLDFGITNRISIGARFQVVRQFTRESYLLDSTGTVPADTAGGASSIPCSRTRRTHSRRFRARPALSISSRETSSSRPSTGCSSRTISR